jgi:PhnB protein
MQIQPYLFFDGRCEEAIDFYAKSAGAKVEMMMRFKEAPPDMPASPEHAEKIMHANVRIGDSTVLMSDGRCTGQMNFQGFAMSLIVGDDTEAAAKFAALGEGGQVQMPLGKTFFSSSFGMLADKFGVSWMVLVTPH